MNSIFLAYAGPPLIGAFIGYLTNRIAIRMLFRPLRPWRVLGYKVPMTPGVIPAKRHELAENIGEMVGSHLLTSRDIGAALSEERFQVHLRELVGERVDDLMRRELGRLPEVIPERFRSYFQVAVKAVKAGFSRGVRSYLQSSEFENRVADTVTSQLESFGTKQLNEVLSAEERQAIYGFIDRLIGDILDGDEAEKRLADYLRHYFEQSAAEGGTIAHHLPEPLYNLVLEIIRDHSPEILRQMSKMLTEPPIRERVIRTVRDWVEKFIRSFGPLGAVARTFLDMNVVEDRVRDYLDKNRENIIAWLQNPEVQEKFTAALTEQTRGFLDTPLAKIMEQAGDERVEAICREVSVQIFALVRSPGVKGAMAALLRENLEHMLGHGEQSIAEIGKRMLTAKTVKSLRLTATEETVALMRTQRVQRMLDQMMNSMFDEFLDRPVGALHNLLPREVRSGIADYVTVSINRILLREVPSLVEQLNIRRIVTEKVDSLDLLRLERLLLSIMQEQFKYINLFGALLGFIIGLANVVILRLAG
jgi:uncharacterized membrane protein YheB (UPF0754 family)